ncbi:MULTISPECIES: hypothetical protein [Eubacterium]|uniref:Uncharacterized protein n=1 Tax=Eubacterium barkeri TaxID=1528 RepID=A0A1H3CHJ7_EUBBA|nr:hypothetical protein [Eubacterium barkeri]SDX53490.1 hypothetical protein SAMN04488579_103102 [Eubacterium barkeri]
MELKMTFCPFCQEKHEVELRWENEQYRFDEIVVVYPKAVYYCDRTNNEFVSAGLESDNEEAAYRAYLEQHGRVVADDFEENIVYEEL